MMVLSAVARAFDITYMRLINRAKSKNDQIQSKQYLVEIKQGGLFEYTELTFDINVTSIHHLSVLFYLSLIGTVVGGICLGTQEAIKPIEKLGIVDDLGVVLMLFASAALVIFSQILYSLATKHEDVSKLAVMYYFQIIMAFIWEGAIFGG